MPIPRRRDQIAVSSNVSTLHPPCSFSRHQMVHFDFPRADGRQIFSIPCCGESIVTASPPRGSSCDPARSDSGPVILVFVDKDGKYYTDYGSQGIHLRHIDRLMLAVLKQLEGDAQPLQQLDVADTTKLEELSITATSSSSYKQDTIWFRTEYGWQITFYTWIDHAGSFHTYPNVGGPFHSLDQVDKAIDQYLSHCLHPKMRMEQDSVSQEMAVWQSLHWPDGRRRMRLETEPIDERRCSVLQLVKALLDKYNDDHNLSEDLEYKLEHLWRYRYFHDADSNGVYYHINFTTKTKGVDGHCNLFFFAELVLRGRKEFVVSCLCRVDVRNASCCYACMSDIMRHPKAGAYSGGLSEDCCSRGMFCYAGPDVDLGCTHEELEAEEASVRHMYEGLDTSDFLESQVEEVC